MYCTVRLCVPYGMMSRVWKEMSIAPMDDQKFPSQPYIDVEALITQHCYHALFVTDGQAQFLLFDVKNVYNTQ